MSQFSTFYLGTQLYGIEVTRVQEVTRPMPLTRVPLAPDYVHGLINLRGQIATAIGLRSLFRMTDSPPQEHMNVVCQINGLLLSLLVDRIGDVIEPAANDFETTPDTIPGDVKKYMNGVYKTPGDLLSVIEIEKISEALQGQAI